MNKPVPIESPRSPDIETAPLISINKFARLTRHRALTSHRASHYILTKLLLWRQKHENIFGKLAESAIDKTDYWNIKRLIFFDPDEVQHVNSNVIFFLLLHPLARSKSKTIHMGTFESRFNMMMIHTYMRDVHVLRNMFISNYPCFCYPIFFWLWK